ncbi:MAG TPA: triple tyrosine motif-containing protein, partial [Bacteroidales bacterium]|nr:triple tyrosine motif-containing protein [Bacteroidales bacterium]
KGFSESSRYIEWDNDDLWISHGYKGLFRLKFTDDFTKVIDIKSFDADKFSDGNSSQVLTKLDDELIISSNTALYRITESDTVEYYNELDDYFSESYPDRMIQDRYKNIWYFINGSAGVLRPMEDGSYKNIRYPFIPLKNKLVPSFESVYVKDRNNIIFGVEDGFSHYSVMVGIDYSRPFALHLREFREIHDSISYVLHQDGNFEFEQNILPEFQYRDNHIITRYAAASYTDGSIEYSTYLSNYDMQWTSWDDDNSREFARLKEGHYKFMVKARNSYGKQSQPLVFSFVILPPWYRSTIAKIVYLLIIIMLIVLIIFFFNKRVEANRRVEIQKQKEKYRIREEQLNNEALKVEQELVRMKNEKLRNEMLYKEKELANSAMNILQKNKALIKIKNRMLKIKMLSNNPEVKAQMDQLIRKINHDIDTEDYWNVFEVHLEQVHQDFLKRLYEKHPDLNYREQKLCAYIRMGMSSKEIAALINISFRAVENNRYRLRQKLDLAQGDNLSHYINSL